jgi:hypothetical protein
MGEVVGAANLEFFTGSEKAEISVFCGTVAVSVLGAINDCGLLPTSSTTVVFLEPTNGALISVAVDVDSVVFLAPDS